MFTSRSVSDTREFGTRFAAQCGVGSVVALEGDLGTGKTQFVKGLAAGLGCGSEVTSPTFALIHEYRGGRVPLYHFDLYRIENARDVERLDIDDYFRGDGVSVVEWADRFREVIPTHAYWLRFRETAGNEREIVLQAPR